MVSLSSQDDRSAPAMLDKSYSLCSSPGRVTALLGVSLMAGARTRPGAGRGTALTGQRGATCSPWGQKGGQSPPNTWAEQGREAAPRRPWSDFYQQGGKRCWEGWHKESPCGGQGHLVPRCDREAAAPLPCCDHHDPLYEQGPWQERQPGTLSPQDWGFRPPSLPLAP